MKVIDDWQDNSQVADMMTRLYEDPKLQEVLRIIEMISLEKLDNQKESKWR
ncbi:hypothetical protein [Planococcus maitriensis]|nr:hypothetical protein [Planococcus maitriensis]